MTDRPDYAEIIRRLEGASGPDRELDAAIVAVLSGALVKRYPPSDDFGPKDRWQFWSVDGKHFLGSEKKFPVASLTASLDASLALVGERLGGKIGPVELSIAGSAQCSIESGDPCSWTVQAFGNTPPLAVLLALFRALESGS